MGEIAFGVVALPREADPELALAVEKCVDGGRPETLRDPPAKQPVVDLKDKKNQNLYPVNTFSVDADVTAKLDLLVRADKTARAYDPRIKQVQASYIDETKHVLIVTSEGRASWDLQPLVRLNVMCIAEENGKRQSGYQGGGGRRARAALGGP